jgi:hypothetical protein
VSSVPESAPLPPPVREWSAISGDQLTRDERIRLEALNQAVQSTAVNGPRLPADIVIEQAVEFEKFIRHGEGVTS